MELPSYSSPSPDVGKATPVPVPAGRSDGVFVAVSSSRLSDSCANFSSIPVVFQFLSVLSRLNEGKAAPLSVTYTGVSPSSRRCVSMQKAAALGLAWMYIP